MQDRPLTSTDDVETFAPPGSPRRYRLAPLSVRERIAFRARLTEQAGIMPSQHDLFLAMRSALAEVNPSNIDELRAIIDQAHAIRTQQDAALMSGATLPAPTPDEQVALGHCLALEARLSVVPLYAALLNQRDKHNALAPLLAAQAALRGWEGPGLPEFTREDGLVPEALLEVLDGLGELNAVGWRAQRLAMPGSSAVGNFGSPTPSSETPTPAEVATSPKMARGGSSRGKNGTSTRAS